MCAKKEKIDSSHFSPDTVELVKLLYLHRVRYLLIGGEAVIFYGHARLTGDVDFFYENTEQNVELLYKALIDFWCGSVPEIQDADELREDGLILQFGRPPNRIDLINQISGVTFNEAWPERTEAVIECPSGEETPVFYMGRKQLIKNKNAAARPKDLDDIPYLGDTNR